MTEKRLLSIDSTTSIVKAVILKYMPVTINICTALTNILLIIAILSAFGCSSKHDQQKEIPSEEIIGTVMQGAVKEAAVFADHASGAEANYKIDDSQTGEPDNSTTSSDAGLYSLRLPDYDYILVSQGGADTISGKQAMEMLAVAGAKNISPFTTMHALTEEKQREKMQLAIETLGISYDENLTKTITPAALFLVQSIQAAVVALTELLSIDGATNEVLLPASQANDIQRTIMSEISEEILNQSSALSSGDIRTKLTDASELSATLKKAVTDAIDVILDDEANSNISVDNPSAVADLIFDGPEGIVNTVADVIRSTTYGADISNTTNKYAEDSIIASAEASAINAAVALTVSSARDSGLVAIAAPPDNRAPTISGTAATSVYIEQQYSFTPQANDLDGDGLRFSIVNKPAWAGFNVGTGALTGAPTRNDVGTTAGIIISVTDGIGSHTVSMAAFDLTVNDLTGSAGSSVD